MTASLLSRTTNGTTNTICHSAHPSSTEDAASPLTISRRPLKPEEIDAAIEEIRHTPHITFVGRTVWERFPSVYIAQCGGAFVGCCAAITLGKWTKIGPLLICERFRRQGYGKRLLAAAVERNRMSNLFIATSHPAVRHLAGTLGFTRIPVSATPSEVKRYLAHFIFNGFSVSLLTAFLRKTLFGGRGILYCFVRKTAE